MTRITTLLFWMGGVVTQHVSEAALEVLLPEDKPASPKIQRALFDLEMALCTGDLSPEQYCQQAIQATQATLEADDLAAGIPDHLQPLPGIPPLIDELAETIPLRLVSGYPKQWTLPVLQRAELTDRFESSILYAAEYHPADCCSALFEAMLASGEIVKDQMIWIDANSHRTSAAIRLGIDASVYVDAVRLRRDLALWGLVPPESHTRREGR